MTAEYKPRLYLYCTI